MDGANMEDAMRLVQVETLFQFTAHFDCTVKRDGFAGPVYFRRGRMRMANSRSLAVLFHVVVFFRGYTSDRLVHENDTILFYTLSVGEFMYS